MKLRVRDGDLEHLVDALKPGEVVIGDLEELLGVAVASGLRPFPLGHLGRSVGPRLIASRDAIIPGERLLLSLGIQTDEQLEPSDRPYCRIFVARERWGGFYVGHQRVLSLVDEVIGLRPHLFRKQLIPVNTVRGDFRRGLPYLGERFLRTSGALGDGCVGKLQKLRVLIVGAGRTGALISMSLARLGVANLVVVDPDHVELGNLDATMGFMEGDIGLAKAEVVVARAKEICGALEGAALVEDVRSVEVVSLLGAMDFLIVAVDRDDVRYSTLAWAVRFGLPAMDVSVGVRSRHGVSLEMGGDIRLFMPGRGCVLCMGGLLTNPLLHETNDERQGSFLGLNQIAAGLAIDLFRRFVDGVESSEWIHFDLSPTPRVSRSESIGRPDCPLCAVARGVKLPI